MSIQQNKIRYKKVKLNTPILSGMNTYPPFFVLISKFALTVVFNDTLFRKLLMHPHLSNTLSVNMNLNSFFVT